MLGFGRTCSAYLRFTSSEKSSRRRQRKSVLRSTRRPRAISVNVLLGLHATAQRLIADAQAIVAPTLLLVSGADRGEKAQYPVCLRGPASV